MLDAAVESHSRRANATYDLVGKSRSLLSHCIADFGARGDLA
jgi:hypothetical protein